MYLLPQPVVIGENWWIARFKEWRELSSPGDHFVYYAGDLQYDRQDPRNPQADLIDELGDYVWAHRAEGQGARNPNGVLLTQRRAAPHAFIYIATRRPT